MFKTRWKDGKKHRQKTKTCLAESPEAKSAAGQEKDRKKDRFPKKERRETVLALLSCQVMGRKPFAARFLLSLGLRHLDRGKGVDRGRLNL